MQKRKMINLLLCYASQVSYWALNMIQRKPILQQRGIFPKQNPGEAHLTTEELQEIAANNNTDTSLSKMSRYISNITGSNAY